MNLQKHLIDLFLFNDSTNKKLLATIKQLEDKQESIRLFSHLINCQYKWKARLDQYPDVQSMSWWEPVYSVEELEEEWNKSLQPWLIYLGNNDEQALRTEVSFFGQDDTPWAAEPKDIILQLNYHSIHHRGQIQTIIRTQGHTPDFVDYIATKYRKL
ncbi:hypothetical protein LVD15_07690 [Fulvivirga maritima]|uniref:DinB family protein n=1 Tax=Fulvivirga maritima TaxID=2904247 RepID=UPI001F21FE67|nr:DinB family protein [Fulvivirga maritima]UII28299.1 hypothetical protein LVD15_07690 [Fulvivirga maritima]